MTPRSQRIAYQIWCYAEPRGWDVTMHELAEATGETWHSVKKVLQDKGWNARVRKVSGGGNEYRWNRVDAHLSDLERWA